jgi:plastocyanin
VPPPGQVGGQSADIEAPLRGWSIPGRFRLPDPRFVAVPRCLPFLATALVLAAACPAPGGLGERFRRRYRGKPLTDAVVMLEPAAVRLPVAPLAGVQIAQLKRQFAPQVSVVTVGTPVSFPNDDTVRHHVYSFSSVKTFELKLYAGVPNAPVVFDKPGIAVLGCNIHDQMVAWVVVVDTPCTRAAPRRARRGSTACLPALPLRSGMRRSPKARRRPRPRSSSAAPTSSSGPRSPVGTGDERRRRVHR